MKTITENQWDLEVLQASEPVMVDVYSDTCAPCKALAKILDKIAPEYVGKVKIVKLNAVDASGIAQKYSLSSVPTLLFFDGGELTNKHVGFATEAKLKTLLDAV